MISIRRPNFFRKPERCRKFWSYLLTALASAAFIVFAGLPVLDSAAQQEVVLQNRLLGPLDADDPFVLKEIRQKYLFDAPGPSLISNDIIIEMTTGYEMKSFSFQFYDRVVNELFISNNITGEYFIEAGALDGVYASNTLKLEFLQQWTGLLVEPDPDMFELLLNTKRNSQAIRACISPHSYPYKALLRTLSPEKSPHDSAISYKSMTSLVFEESDDRTFNGFPTYREVICFPIRSILLAAQVSHVTLFSLDIEDAEWKILETFPFESVKVDVWFVEHRTRDDVTGALTTAYDPEFVKWFAARNYSLYDFHLSNVPDYVFIYNNSRFRNIRPKTTQA
ncbi:uncharacterized protein LOC108672655 [Hyalella azteca]|uniref:Uncharacterized protein LOC108672655 n=1 Tax=Hyalella azteca TaxID=294128 RepID=A0A8B7NQ43_HYAAZ|nr:uncharacterized protein LOC108672655 [Hyalella azteca]